MFEILLLINKYLYLCSLKNIIYNIMKKLFILSLATLGFIACSKRADYIVLSGKIDGYNGVPIKVIGGDLNVDLKVKPDGTFRDTLRVATNYYYYSITNPMYGINLPVYLEKGGQVNVDIDLTGKGVNTTFGGDNTAINNYLQKKEVIHLDAQESLTTLFSKNPEEFRQDVVALSKQFLDLLNSEKELSKGFVTMEIKSINYEMLYIKSLYEGAHKQLKKEEVKLPKEMADELKRLNKDLSQDFEIHRYYKELLMDDLYNKYEASVEKNLDPWDNIVKHIDSLKSENIRGGLSRSLISAISVINTPETNDQLIKIVRKNVKDAAGKEDLEKRLAVIERLKEGKEFPSFEGEDMQGNTVTYENLKGKLTYIDIWATWCTPCRGEMPALQALEEEYKDKNITFVSLSIDTDKAAWKGFVEGEKLGGVQLYLKGDAPALFEKYDITGIPRFILVDKEGKIININAPRPSDSKIKELINAHL